MKQLKADEAVALFEENYELGMCINMPIMEMTERLTHLCVMILYCS